MESVVNNALNAAGVPPVQGINATAPTGLNACYYPNAWRGNAAHSMGVPPGTFGRTPPNPRLGSTMYHEARHASQLAANARYLASQGMTAGRIYQTMGTSASVAMHGVANPAGPGTAVGQLGAMNNAQNYGSGKPYNDYVRQNQQRAYSSGVPGDYTDAMDMYWSLPNERDAEDAGEAMRAICPDTR
jgi:hypothetical protein